MFFVCVRVNERVVNRVWVESLAAARRVAWQIQNRLAWDGVCTEAWIVEVPEEDVEGTGAAAPSPR